MATLFFSYSHKDEDLRDRLEVHLSMLKRQKAIETWHDRRITAGDGFAGRIDENLAKADVILLLVSADFIASSYCYDVELNKAMEMHACGQAKVIPVILRHCDWHSAPFGQLLAAPKDGKPVLAWPDLDAAFLDIVKKIRESLPRPAAISTTTTFEITDLSSLGPRSSNLRLTKSFTEADKDRFLADTFSHFVKFFENSLGELQSRNADIETSFRLIDANRFLCNIYRRGFSVSKCKIALGSSFGRGISYSSSDREADNSINDALSVKADSQALFLEAMDTMGSNQGDQKLSQELAAEYYWSKLLLPLQG